MIRFRVRSSSSNGAYEVSAQSADGRVRFTCTCPAGQSGQHCKHRIALLNGDGAALLSGHENLEGFLYLVSGTALVTHLGELTRLEQEADEIRRRIVAVKKALAREMAG